MLIRNLFAIALTGALAAACSSNAPESPPPAVVPGMVHIHGLGINPDAPEWKLVKSVMALHDHDFNSEWIRAWTTHKVGMKELDKIRDQVRRFQRTSPVQISPCF